MPKDVIMPALGMAQETGLLLQWLKSEGDNVSQGEPLMEIETDKATVEVEAPASGTLVNVSARPGDEIPVGQTIALIVAPGEKAPEPLAETDVAAAPVTPAVASAAPSKPEDHGVETLASPLAVRIAAEHNVDLNLVKPDGGRIQKQDVLDFLALQQTTVTSAPANGKILASPKARRLAREQNLNLATIKGSGPDGAVLAADVLAAAEATQLAEAAPLAPAVPEPQLIPMSRMWQIMAQRLTESWTSVPHFYLAAEANARGLARWRESAQSRVTDKLTYTDLLVKIVAVALRSHQRLNAKWVDGTIVANRDINIGLAVAVEDGLVVPVIQRADQLGLAEIAARRKDLVARAQQGKLTLAEISDGTFTISNLGMYGIDAFSAIVNPPQAAILALGRIADRVVPVNGQPAVQPMIMMTLSCDHRVVDGARAAQFVQTLVRSIEEPLILLD